MILSLFFVTLVLLFRLSTAKLFPYYKHKSFQGYKIYIKKNGENLGQGGRI